MTPVMHAFDAENVTKRRQTGCHCQSLLWWRGQ